MKVVAAILTLDCTPVEVYGRDLDVWHRIHEKEIRISVSEEQARELWEQLGARFKQNAEPDNDWIRWVSTEEALRIFLSNADETFHRDDAIRFICARSGCKESTAAVVLTNAKKKGILASSGNSIWRKVSQEVDR